MNEYEIINWLCIGVVILLALVMLLVIREHYTARRDAEQRAEIVKILRQIDELRNMKK